MNVGGPAYHVSLLSGRLPKDRYETLLVAGNVGQGEASFAGLARFYGAELRLLDALGPELRPLSDLRALRDLIRLMRSFRPDIVHTHTAKAGALGRLAARIALGGRPLVVHTYHGHVLTGYFGAAKTLAFRWVERILGLITDRLVGVSQSTVDDLVRLRIARRNKFTVVRLGLDLDRFLTIEPEDGTAFRQEIGAGKEECVALSVGRLVPIKRIDIALQAVAHARSCGAPVFLVVVGDGQLRGSLERMADRFGIRNAVRFLGFRNDLDRVVAGSDIALLTSDNEGTPVALIEAAAGALPSVATAVGGVAEIVTAATGRLAPAGDVLGIGDALANLAGDAELRARLGAAGRAHVRSAYAAERLLHDIDDLYSSLIARRAA